MHPFINLAVRLKYREAGYDPSEIRAAMRGFSPKVVKQATDEACAQMPNEKISPVVSVALLGTSQAEALNSSPGNTGAFGDGTIIKAITDFFNSPLGQLIMQLIMSFLMA